MCCCCYRQNVLVSNELEPTRFYVFTAVMLEIKFILVACCAVKLSEEFQNFRRITIPPSLGWRSPSRNEDITIRGNVEDYLERKTAWHRKRQKTVRNLVSSSQQRDLKSVYFASFVFSSSVKDDFRCWCPFECDKWWRDFKGVLK